MEGLNCTVAVVYRLDATQNKRSNPNLLKAMHDGKFKYGVERGSGKDFHDTA